MSPEILDELKQINEKLTRIDASLYPDGPNQPGRLLKLETQVDSLVGWRNMLIGAWGVLAAGLSLAAKKFWH